MTKAQVCGGDFVTQQIAPSGVIIPGLWRITGVGRCKTAVLLPRVKTHHLIRVVASLQRCWQRQARLMLKGFAPARTKKQQNDNAASSWKRVRARNEGHLVILLFAVGRDEITFAASLPKTGKNILCRAYYRALS